MHHKRIIREAVVARLEARIGSAVTAVFAGRAGGVVADGELNVVLVDCMDSKSLPLLPSDQDSTERVAYRLVVQPVVDGPEPDLADGLPSCAETIDELTVGIRRALSREWALDGGLGIPARAASPSAARLLDFRFLQDGVLVVRGGKGLVAHNPIQFVAEVVCPDGEVDVPQE